MAITQATSLADFSTGIGTAGAVLQVDNADGKVGIGTTDPQGTLQVGIAITMDGTAGVITASSFSGSGGNLTFTGADISAATGTFTGNVSVGGTLTYEDVTNIDSVGIVTARQGIDIQGGIGATFADNVKAFFGTGGDLQIYHNGTDSYVENSTGDLYLRCTGDDEDVLIQTDLGNGDVTTYILCDGSTGEVDLYHAGSRKLNTKSDGVDITGELQCDSLDVDGTSDFAGDVTFNGDNYSVLWDKSEDRLEFGDNAKATFGASADLQIYHDGSNSFIKDDGTGEIKLAGTVRVVNNGNTETIAKFIPDGAVELHYDNSKKFETKSDGVDITGELQCDSLDVDGTTSFADDVSFDGTSYGARWDKSENQLEIDDNAKIVFGTGADLEIYHDGSASYIHDNGTGDLNICMESGSKLVIQSGTSGNHLAEFNHNGAAELFHNGSQKLATSSSGVTVTGTVSDSVGPLRRLNVAGKSSDFTLTAANAGALLRRTGGNATVPADVFTAGDMITIFNAASSGDMTVLSSAVTLINSADGDAGNTRTIASKGMATIVCTASNEFVISGSQLT